MRGVVSLAAALSIPLLIGEGQPFPYRNLILFITFIVILVTLVIQGSNTSLANPKGKARRQVYFDTAIKAGTDYSEKNRTGFALLSAGKIQQGRRAKRTSK